MHFGFNNQFIKVKRTLAKISETTKIQNIGIRKHIGFNNQFIKVTRIRPIFQNFQKNLFFFFQIFFCIFGSFD